MAAPHVSGVAALLFQEHPEATPAQVKEALRRGAERLPRLGDPEDQGNGLVDAVRSLEQLDRLLPP
ncbi:MAG: S8 family serine peptidase [Armatimonadetes bacterium]|nr:S8 family serine peptidase [Armatimonadota bacterium]